MESIEIRTLSARRLALLLAGALAAAALAGCGGSEGGGGGAGKGEGEAAPALHGAGEEGEGPTVSTKAAEEASLKREKAELAATTHHREQLEREQAAATVQSKQKGSGRAKHHSHKARQHGTRPPKKHTGANAKKQGSVAEQEARKHFEAEEAREAAEYKRKANAEK